MLYHSHCWKTQTYSSRLLSKTVRIQDDEKVCAVKCLEEYIKRKKDLRLNCDQLLLCHARPHGSGSKDTVLRRLRDVLSDAELCDFKTHTFRGASASAMLSSGATLDGILKSAGWTNASTFHKFYYRPVKEAQKLHRDLKSSLKYFQNKQEYVIWQMRV